MARQRAASRSAAGVERKHKVQEALRVAQRLDEATSRETTSCVIERASWTFDPLRIRAKGEISVQKISVKYGG